MSTPIETAAERLSDSLTQLGVDPDERPEHGGRSIAEVLGAAALASLAQHRDDIARVQREHRSWVENYADGRPVQYRCLCGHPLPVGPRVLLAPLADAQAAHQADAVLALITGGPS